MTWVFQFTSLPAAKCAFMSLSSRTIGWVLGMRGPPGKGFTMSPCSPSCTTCVIIQCIMRMDLCESTLISMCHSIVQHTRVQLDWGCLLKESSFVPQTIITVGWWHYEYKTASWLWVLSAKVLQDYHIIQLCCPPSFYRVFGCPRPP